MKCFRTETVIRCRLRPENYLYMEAIGSALLSRDKQSQRTAVCRKMINPKNIMNYPGLQDVLDARQCT